VRPVRRRATAPVQPRAGTRPAGAGLALPTDEVPSDLIDAAAPARAGEAPRARPARSAPAPGIEPPASQAPGTTGGPPSYKFVNDGFIEVPTAPQPAAQAPAEPSNMVRGVPVSPPTEPVDWEELANELQQRIIRIPADKLRNGDPTYNIVVVNDDWIRVDPGPVGLYYMAGHVSRPGPYAFAGEQITLTQAVAAAGGFDQLAWPPAAKFGGGWTRTARKSRSGIWPGSSTGGIRTCT